MQMSGNHYAGLKPGATKCIEPMALYKLPIYGRPHRGQILVEKQNNRYRPVECGTYTPYFFRNHPFPLLIANASLSLALVKTIFRIMSSGSGSSGLK